MRGKNNTTGLALAEVYDLGTGPTSQLGNISSRGFVGSTSADNMIAGFIPNAANTRVVVRALGPTLTQFGVSGALADPTLAIFDADGVQLASNDNWQSGTQATQIQAAGYAPPNPSEAAIIIERPPGNTTAIVSGKNAATGVALVEVYYLP